MVIKNSNNIIIEWIVSFILLILILQDTFMIISPLFGYLDELFIVFILTLYLYKLLKNKKIPKIDLKILVLSLIVVTIGIISNYVFNYVTNFVYILVDIITIFKFVIIFLFFKSNFLFNIKNIKVLESVLFPYSLVMFVLAMQNLFTLNMTYEVRYGLPAFKYIFEAPGMVINQMICIIMVIRLASSNQNKRNYYRHAAVLLCLTTIVLTLRTRAFVFIFLYFLFYLISSKINTKNGKFYLLTSLVLTIPLALSQFSNYYYNDTPRSRFLKNSFYLIKKHFPLGSGFGSYGSAVAADNYSKLYYELGFNSYYGMGPNDNLFLHDNYWPMIFSQLGIIGTLFFLRLLYLIFSWVIINILHKKDNQVKAVLLSVVVSTVLTTFQSSSLAHYSIVPIFTLVMLGIVKYE